MDVYDIPKNIVYEFLKKYFHDLILDDDNYYDILLDLITSGEVESAPNEIVNWIIAYNNKNNINIGTYKLSDILLNKIDLIELYEMLDIDNKDDLIQILFYLNKVDDDLSLFNKLPDEILKKILIELDINSLLLWFNVSPLSSEYSKKQFDNILRSKILPYMNLYQDINLESLNNKELIVLMKTIEKGRHYRLNNKQLIVLMRFIKDGKYHGIIINNEFRIIDDETQQLLLTNGDKRFISLGRRSNSYSTTDLLEILWNIDGILPDKSVILKEEDRENIIKKLLRHGYNYVDLKSWTLNKLTFFYNWLILKRKPTKQFLSDVIRSRMEDLNMIKYL